MVNVYSVYTLYIFNIYVHTIYYINVKQFNVVPLTLYVHLDKMNALTSFNQTHV
jgi:hypothetical protein